MALSCHHCKYLSYICTVLFLTAFVLSLTIITNLTLWKLKTFALAMFKSFADTSDSILFCHVPRTSLCLSLLIPFSTHLLLFLHTLSKWLVCLYLEQFSPLPHAMFHSICLFGEVLFCIFACFPNHQPFGVPFLLYQTLFFLWWWWVLLFAASAPLLSLAQLSTCLLVISLVFFIMVNSFMISIIISPLLIPLMKCSFSNLLLSFCLHSFALILRWQINSWTLVLCSLTSLHYWSENILSFCRNLKILLNTLNSSELFLHFSFSLSINAWTNMGP